MVWHINILNEAVPVAPLAIGNLLFYALAIAIIQLNLGWLALAGLVAAAFATLAIALKYPQSNTLS